EDLFAAPGLSAAVDAVPNRRAGGLSGCPAPEKAREENDGQKRQAHAADCSDVNGAPAQMKQSLTISAGGYRLTKQAWARVFRARARRRITIPEHCLVAWIRFSREN